MKLAIQEGLLPGRTLSERMDLAAAYGFEAIEIGGAKLLDEFDSIASSIAGHQIAVSTICAGYGGCPLDPSKPERDRAASDLRLLLEAGAALGAVGVIFVPIFGPARIADLSPYKTARELELELLVEWLRPLEAIARKTKCLLLVEPLNRYETHLLNTLRDAEAVIRKVGGRGLAAMADLFHMSIEEDAIATAIRSAKRIAHVHLADSQRLQPGTGHLDFRSAFHALCEVGYSGYLALECGVRGKAATALPQCVEFLRAQLA